MDGNKGRIACGVMSSPSRGHRVIPGGALAVPLGDEIVVHINALATRFANVVLTQDWHPPGHISFASSHPSKRPFETVEVSYGRQVLWPDHCVQGSEGAQLHPTAWRGLPWMSVGSASTLR